MTFQDKTENKSAISKVHTETTVALPEQEFSKELQDLNEQVWALMVLGENMILTNKQKTTGQLMQIRDHIEARHIEGISIPCKVCAKSFTTRSALRQHQKTDVMCTKYLHK